MVVQAPWKQLDENLSRQHPTNAPNHVDEKESFCTIIWNTGVSVINHYNHLSEAIIHHIMWELDQLQVAIHSGQPGMDMTKLVWMAVNILIEWLMKALATISSHYHPMICSVGSTLQQSGPIQMTVPFLMWILSCSCWSPLYHQLLLLLVALQCSKFFTSYQELQTHLPQLPHWFFLCSTLVCLPPMTPATWMDWPDWR